MTYNWDDAKSVLEHVKVATDRLYEIEITPKIKEVLPLLSQIVEFAGRFGELTSDEGEQVDHLCCQVSAYLCISRVTLWCVKQESDSTESLQYFRKKVKEIRQLVEIGTDFVSDLVFALPRRIEEDLVDDIRKILELCKSKPIAFYHHLPLEIVPVTLMLADFSISLRSLYEFETSLAALGSFAIPSDLSLTFQDFPLEDPITVLAVNYVTKLFKLQNVTVIMATLILNY
jgi:hypothetical protein